MTALNSRHRRVTDRIERRSRSRAMAIDVNDSEVRFPMVQFGRIHAHAVDRDEAIAAILTRVRSGRGGYVVTPNVDHICVAETDPEFRAAYREAFLCLPDGQPLLWMAQALGTPLPEKISGSDLIRPLLDLGAAQGCTVFFLGASEDTCAESARRLAAEIPDLHVVGWACPFFDPDGDANQLQGALEKVKAAQPDIVLVAMSTPKQEYFMLRHAAEMTPAVAVGIGAGLDFVAGKVTRAPLWMSTYGFEWLYRLSREPGRMWRRYLVRDRAIVGIFLRTRREAKRRRSHGGLGS
jgi:N-acetylglucosaminyldiphosphoundecaprenol N-acetyl-beta-D-mannosaminyltransferase